MKDLDFWNTHIAVHERLLKAHNEATADGVAENPLYLASLDTAIREGKVWRESVSIRARVNMST